MQRTVLVVKIMLGFFFSLFISRHCLLPLVSFIGKSCTPHVQDLRFPLPNSTAIKISSLFANSLPSPPDKNPHFCSLLCLLLQKLHYKNPSEIAKMQEVRIPVETSYAGVLL